MRADIERRLALWMLLGSLLPAILLSLLASGTNVLSADVRITRFIQQLPESPSQDLANFGNFIGSATGCIIATAAVAIFLIAKHDRRDAVFAALSLAMHPANRLLKEIVESPRPTSDLVRVSEIASGYGFPSGHAMGATLCYGSIFVIAFRSAISNWLKYAIEPFCVLLILLVGFGRIYIGVHWPSDVVGGYLWGIALIATLALIFERVPRPESRPANPAGPSPAVY